MFHNVLVSSNGQKKAYFPETGSSLQFYNGHNSCHLNKVRYRITLLRTLIYLCLYCCFTKFCSRHTSITDEPTFPDVLTFAGVELLLSTLNMLGTVVLAILSGPLGTFRIKHVLSK